MEKDIRFSSQPLRGKNWTDEDTRIFIRVLERYFPKLQGRCRKGKVFDQIASHLRETYGLLRTSKEVQNKYKSIVREYRNALTQYVRDKTLPPNYKWFANLHPFMKHTLLTHSESSQCSTIENQDFPLPLIAERQEYVKASHTSENLRMLAYPTVNSAHPSHGHVQSSLVAAEKCHNQGETPISSESLPVRELHIESATSFSKAENLAARKKTFASRDDDEDHWNNTPECALRLIKEELKEHKKISTQVQMKMCDSLENFNLMIQSLNGALSMIPNLFSQLMQCQTHQLSQFSQQNRQPASVILSPLPQPANQQFEQSTCAQYVWLFDPSSNMSASKAALPGP